MENIVAIMNFW